MEKLDRKFLRLEDIFMMDLWRNKFNNESGSKLPEVGYDKVFPIKLKQFDETFEIKSVLVDEFKLIDEESRVFYGQKDPEFKSELIKSADGKILMGHLRYGNLKSMNLDSYDYAKEILIRYSHFLESRILDYLVDALNFVRIEYYKQSKRGLLSKEFNLVVYHCNPHTSLIEELTNFYIRSDHKHRSVLVRIYYLIMKEYAYYRSKGLILYSVDDGDLHSEKL